MADFARVTTLRFGVLFEQTNIPVRVTSLRLAVLHSIPVAPPPPPPPPSGGGGAVGSLRRTVGAEPRRRKPRDEGYVPVTRRELMDPVLVVAPQLAEPPQVAPVPQREAPPPLRVETPPDTRLAEISAGLDAVAEALARKEADALEKRAKRLAEELDDEEAIVWLLH